MRQRITKYRGVGLAMLVMTIIVMGVAYAQDSGKGATSYAPVDIKEDFASIMARMKAAKSEIMKRHMDLLNERYDLSNRPANGVTMSRGKAVQEGVRIKLLKGMTWENLAAMSPEEIREKALFPAGFFPTPVSEPPGRRHAFP